jgi:hypothetical protein
MANNFIQLGNLNFDDIKNSIKSYMEDQSELDFNFDGSIASTMLEMLAYNTMYYAFYSNMLINESYLSSAQRVESVISLVKPFGYTVSHKASASVELEGTSTAPITLIPYYSAFQGTIDGVKYTFYYTGDTTEEFVASDDSIAIHSGNTVNWTIYQGKSVSIKTPIEVDYTKQTAILSNKSIDIRTLRVYVEEAGRSQFTQYDRVKNASSNIDSSSRVYYLEATNNGYKIFFGGNSSTDGSQIGRGVGNNEKVFVSYVNTSGKAANNSTNFTSTISNLTITNSTSAASGGYNSPDIDLIKFLAPREFASSGNIVSVSDYENAIQALNLINVNISNIKNNISVYGSTDSAERIPGTVFYSLIDESTTDVNNQHISSITSTLSDDVMLGISFENKLPINAQIEFNFDEQTVKDKFNEVYNRGGNINTTGFNQTIKSSDIGGSWTAPPVVVATPNSYSFSTVSFDNCYNVDIKNKLDVATAGTTLEVLGRFIVGGGFTAGVDTDSTERTRDITIHDGYGIGGTLGNVNLDTGLFKFDIVDPIGGNSFVAIQKITANYDKGIEIKIKEEMLGTPITV